MCVHLPLSPDTQAARRRGNPRKAGRPAYPSGPGLTVYPPHLSIGPSCPLALAFPCSSSPCLGLGCDVILPNAMCFRLSSVQPCAMGLENNVQDPPRFPPPPLPPLPPGYRFAARDELYNFGTINQRSGRLGHLRWLTRSRPLAPPPGDHRHHHGACPWDDTRARGAEAPAGHARLAQAAGQPKCSSPFLLRSKRLAFPTNLPSCRWSRLEAQPDHVSPTNLNWGQSQPVVWASHSGIVGCTILISLPSIAFRSQRFDFINPPL